MLLESELVALANAQDPRVQKICTDLPIFKDFLSRFTDAFGVVLDPVVLIIRNDARAKITAPDALMSFRDLAAISVVPYCRALNTVYSPTHRIVYSDSFAIYPWTLNEANTTLILNSPANKSFEVVNRFHGQSSPELPILEIADIDTPLLEALLIRWNRHYFGTRVRWKDRALFRSLNMAFHAAAIPAGVGTGILDLGRMVALWVSAFESLAHPGKGKSDLSTVYPLFEGITYCEKDVGRRQYAAYTVTKRPKAKGGGAAKANAKAPRRPLPCWLYGELYKARNKFLHGNRIGKNSLNPQGRQQGLFWLAPPLYRLALAGFLRLTVDHELPCRCDDDLQSPAINKQYHAYDCQSYAERALLRARKRGS